MHRLSHIEKKKKPCCSSEELVSNQEVFLSCRVRFWKRRDFGAHRKHSPVCGKSSELTCHFQSHSAAEVALPSQLLQGTPVDARAADRSVLDRQGVRPCPGLLKGVILPALGELQPLVATLWELWRSNKESHLLTDWPEGLTTCFHESIKSACIKGRGESTKTSLRLGLLWNKIRMWFVVGAPVSQPLPCRGWQVTWGPWRSVHPSGLDFILVVPF